MEPIVKPVHATTISNESAVVTSAIALETWYHGPPVEGGFTTTERCATVDCKRNGSAHDVTWIGHRWPL